MGDGHSEVVEAKSPAFFQKAPVACFGVADVASSPNSLARSIIDSFPRGGAEEENDEEENAETEVLYLPGLLEVELIELSQVSIVVGVNKERQNYVVSRVAGYTFFAVHIVVFVSVAMNGSLFLIRFHFLVYFLNFNHLANCNRGLCCHVVSKKGERTRRIRRRSCFYHRKKTDC